MYSGELVDCNVTTDQITVELLKNGKITNAGAKLRAELVSASSFRFIRFSTRIDVADALDVQVLKT